MMKSFAIDRVEIGPLQIVEDSKCCLKVRSVITRVGVFKYPDGRALKTKMELMKAANAIRFAGAKLTILDHPDSMVVQSQGEIRGGLEKIYFDRDRVRSILNFDKAVCPTSFLEEVRKGNLRENSIGFYYKPDWSPGVWEDPITGKKEPYDYIMRDIVIDHVAAGVLKGRCPFPQCGIGVDAMATDKVVKRGGSWCVIHCSGEKAGQAIKCYSIKEFGDAGAKAKAEKMHRAIQARKGGSASMELTKIVNLNKLSEVQIKNLFGEDAEKPPKEWWDNCEAKAKSFASDPAAFCGWLWLHGEEDMKASFGKASKGGRIGKMSEDEKAAFEACVTKRMAENPELTREAAEALCKPATEPEDQPTPPGGTLDQDELTAWQKCIKEKLEAGKTMDEAQEACKGEGLSKTDADAAFENCVNRKVEQGMPREQAEKECRELHPVAEGQEETDLERCIKNYKESHPDATDAEAQAWCEAELAGEHEAVDAIIERSRTLISLKEERDTERQIAARKK